MGPNAMSIATSLGAQLESLGYFKHTETTLGGIAVRAARLSYVGEAGWEITCESTDAVDLYKALNAAGAKPAGLLAQTSMRVEKGFRAMGHELDADVTPADVGLDLFTRKEGGFVGYDAMKAKSATPALKQIVSLTIDDENAVPLGHEPVITNDKIIGRTTTCAFGYRVGKPIALAYVSSSINVGEQVEIDIAGELFKAQVDIAPLYDATGTRMKVKAA
jgi:4-methylaminobutanoate oxidase (formaldehyde-forming)